MFFILLYQVHSCTTQIEFTDCFENTLAAILTPQNCSNSSQSIHGNLPCNHSCPSGSILSYSSLNSSLICSPCPLNTYNLGGGIDYSSWNNFKDSFHTNCWVLLSTGWSLSFECTSWHASSDSLLVSGTGPKSLWYETDLTFYPKLVKDGYIEINYRKDTSMVNGIESGDFFIFIDEVLSLSDKSLFDFTWKSKKLSLSTGIHKIQLVFNKLVSTQTSEVQIRSLRLSGTSFSDSTCTLCQGHKFELCAYCEAGSYYSIHSQTCEICPDGRTSYPGSTNVNLCFEAQICMNIDSHFYYSDCEAGKQQKVFEWNEPKMCDSDSVWLPETQSVDCVACGPGKEYVYGKCQYCSDGTFSVNGEFGESCQVCKSGEYGYKVMDFYQWTEFPQEFVPSCVIPGADECRYDWETRGDYLVSSPVYPETSQVILQGCFGVVEQNAEVLFDFSVTGTESQFVFSINGIAFFNISGTVPRTVLSFPIEKGKVCLKWVLTHKEKDVESCSIFRITINGTDTGGASRCVACPNGFFSTEASAVCEKCPAGQVSNLNKSACEFCPENKFLDVDGNCLECFTGMSLADDKQSCVLKDELIEVENLKYTLQNFSGLPGKAPFYCSQQQLQMYCYQTFYGPIQGAGNFFYLSVFNAFDVSMLSFPQFFTGPVYSFAVIDLKIMQLEYFGMDKPGEDCDNSYTKVAISLGSQVTNISKDADFGKGFKIEYSKGDLCQNETRFKTLIHFACAKEEEEGWPVFVKYSECVFEFYWLTVHACEICRDDRKVVQNGTCVGGQMDVHSFAGRDCVLENRAEYEKRSVGCIEMHVYRTWPFIVSMIVLGVVLFAVSTVVILACKKRNGYQKLIRSSLERRKGGSSTHNN